MDVSLTPELETFVQAMVESRRYDSASEVLREGLRKLEAEENFRAGQISYFNQVLGLRLDALDRGERADAEEIRSRLWHRSEERRKEKSVAQYVLSTSAAHDLDTIWELIAASNLDAADLWMDKMFDAFRTLANTPGLGRKREDLTDQLGVFWPVGAYMVIYRVHRQPVEIVGAAWGSPDLPSFANPSGKPTPKGRFEDEGFFK